MEIFETVGVFEALAHETRVGVLQLLIPAGATGLAAGDISHRLNLPPNSLSFHLGRLVNSGLIVKRRSGRNHFYAADYARLAALVHFLADDCCANAPDGCLPECPTASEPSVCGCASACDVPDANPIGRK